MDHEKRLEQHDRMIADCEATLRRAIRLRVQDARRQRKSNLEFDEKMTQLAAAQLLTEENLKDMGGKLEDLGRKLAGMGDKLAGLIDALRSGNGHA